MNRIRCSFFVFVFSLLFAQTGRAERWVIATLDWPPYICSSCPQNGAAAQALRGLLSPKGITVEFVFFPWIQAQKNGGKPHYVGYYPAWKEEVLPEFQSSKELFSSPVVFLQRKNNPLKWRELKDLKGKTFVVTQGYGNTEEFNRGVKEGLFKVVPVLSDELLVKKLSEGVADGALMDYKVAQYYLRKMPSEYVSDLEINPKIIEIKKLYLVFNKYSLKKKNQLDELLDATNFSKTVDQLLIKGH